MHPHFSCTWLGWGRMGVPTSLQGFSILPFFEPVALFATAALMGKTSSGISMDKMAARRIVRKPIVWFLGVCAAWWFICLIFPLLAYIMAGAAFTLMGENPEGWPYLFFLLLFAAIGAVPVSKVTIEARSQWRPVVVAITVTALLVVCFGVIALGDVRWLCRFATNGCAPA